MTKKLYYIDAYENKFTATITKVMHAEEECYVVLDQTAFYPTGEDSPMILAK
ncbi:hypothetical protein [Halalkalibacter krulwichiae]|uniref:Alanine--tRNA ligase n=1 Tax=Halalkalibacter krulwichiae TaxID=199441 RepID=A0A1X9MB76_9BACI|nr:hypothetical protein [Halalkalibacter krulwichiae]ARK30677.1 Alanine--tRNA ligase [Halalkalibacter krulwichiae]